MGNWGEITLLIAAITLLIGVMTLLTIGVITLLIGVIPLLRIGVIVLLIIGVITLLIGVIVLLITGFPGPTLYKRPPFKKSKNFFLSKSLPPGQRWHQGRFTRDPPRTWDPLMVDTQRDTQRALNPGKTDKPANDI